MEKKIATSVESLIKVAQYESIRITKYGEARIEYNSLEEMQNKEDDLSNEVIADLERCLRKLPEKFAKASETIVEDFGDKIYNKIPEWLKDGPEPNIANRAKSSHESSDAKADDEQKERVEVTNSTITEMEELFGPDTNNSVKSEPKNEVLNEVVSGSDSVVCEESIEKNEDDGEDFDDEDLFS